MINYCNSSARFVYRRCYARYGIMHMHRDVVRLIRVTGVSGLPYLGTGVPPEVSAGGRQQPRTVGKFDRTLSGLFGAH